jgi:superfamily I DNA and/or RNA helicase
MTYGPQEPRGRVFQRFGPINTDVDWRRLNVLFTRSKKRMYIFSSMGSEDIVACSTAKRGVQTLRDFLSFCETGILHTVEESLM